MVLAQVRILDRDRKDLREKLNEANQEILQYQTEASEYYELFSI